jgi:hypothetical protein
MDVKDNHEEASVGAKLALDLCQKVFKRHSIYNIACIVIPSIGLLITNKYTSLCGFPEMYPVRKGLIGTIVMN